MKIVWHRCFATLGTDRAQSPILLTLNNGRNYLFDCGDSATRL